MTWGSPLAPLVRGESEIWSLLVKGNWRGGISQQRGTRLKVPLPKGDLGGSPHCAGADSNRIAVRCWD